MQGSDILLQFDHGKEQVLQGGEGSDSGHQRRVVHPVCGDRVVLSLCSSVSHRRVWWKERALLRWLSPPTTEDLLGLCRHPWHHLPLDCCGVYLLWAPLESTDLKERLSLHFLSFETKGFSLFA